MCEFKVFLNGERIFEDVIYLKAEGNRVILRNILGYSKLVKDSRIVEVDVSSEKVVLESVG